MFTDLQIRKLKPKDKEYWTREGQGFCIRVLPSGEKTWYYIFTFEGRKRYMRLGEGSYPAVSLADARGYFEAAKAKVKNGVNPLDEKKQAALERKRTPLVSDFVKEYLERHVKTLRSCAEVERALRVEVVPRWGDRKITDITRLDIVALRNEIVGRGAPVMANRCLAYVSGILAYAVEEGFIPVSPYSKIKRSIKEKKGDRDLLPAEIQRLWLALDDDAVMMSDEIRTALKLILVTAQRPGEVIGMHSSELDGRWWTIPASRTKNKRKHKVYLTNTALELIGDTAGKGHIFPAAINRGEKGGSITVNALSFAIRRNIKGQSVSTDKVKRRKGEAYKRGPYNSKQPPENPNRIGIEMFTPHDLRRTANTLMASSGIIKEYRERVLNHTLEKLEAAYNLHDYDKEKQLALEALERKLLSIMHGSKTADVISITRGVAA